MQSAYRWQNSTSPALINDIIINKIVTYLESKAVVFHAALALIILYIPHAGYLFKQIEHIDMMIYGFTIMNWIYRIALAAVIEILILVSSSMDINVRERRMHW